MSHLRGLSHTSSYLYWKNLHAKFDLNLSIISQDIDIERISFLPII